MPIKSLCKAIFSTASEWIKFNYTRCAELKEKNSETAQSLKVLVEDYAADILEISAKPVNYENPNYGSALKFKIDEKKLNYDDKRMRPLELIEAIQALLFLRQDL